MHLNVYQSGLFRPPYLSLYLLLSNNNPMALMSEISSSLFEFDLFSVCESSFPVNKAGMVCTRRVLIPGADDTVRQRVDDLATTNYMASHGHSTK